jgi:hypothetical protein
MARSNGGGFGAILFAKILGALSEHGLARLNMPEILTLLKQVAEAKMPDELVVAVACFIGANPPATDFRGMQEAVRYGQIGGVRGLINLHKRIRDRDRKARVKRAKLSAVSNPSRPILLPLSERKKRRAEVVRRETEAEIAAANKALARLYQARHSAELKRWLDFIEVCQALRGAGFGLVEHHRKLLLEIVAELPRPSLNRVWSPLEALNASTGSPAPVDAVPTHQRPTNAGAEPTQAPELAEATA